MAKYSIWLLPSLPRSLAGVALASVDAVRVFGAVVQLQETLVDVREEKAVLVRQQSRGNARVLADVPQVHIARLANA